MRGTTAALRPCSTPCSGPSWRPNNSGSPCSWTLYLTYIFLYLISYSGCRMVDEGNYSSAASLLHSLLWSRLAPNTSGSPCSWTIYLTHIFLYLSSHSGCRMVDEGNYSSAASLLHSLLWSKLAPNTSGSPCSWTLYLTHIF
jgi:hypothetical protein